MTRFSTAGRDLANSQRTIPLSRYQEDGHESRAEYLEALADEYGVGLRTVWTIAQTLGPNEDFDGLVSMVADEEDFADCLL